MTHPAPWSSPPPSSHLHPPPSCLPTRTASGAGRDSIEKCPKSFMETCSIYRCLNINMLCGITFKNSGYIDAKSQAKNCSIESGPCILASETGGLIPKSCIVFSPFPVGDELASSSEYPSSPSSPCPSWSSQPSSPATPLSTLSTKKLSLVSDLGPSEDSSDVVEE